MVGVTIVIILEDFSIVCGLGVFHIDGFSTKRSEIISFHVLVSFIGSLNRDKLPPLIWFVAFGFKDNFGTVVNLGIFNLHDSA